MRSTLRCLFPVVLALFTAGCPSGDTSEAEGRHLVVLFTTDEHSHLLAVAPEVDDWPLPATAGTGALVGGVARRATILAAERAAATARGADTITLSSGDFSQGTLASAAWLATSSELVLMSQMGYDAVSLGNHEFDLGPTALAGAIGQAATRLAAQSRALPPLVLTNINFSASTADDALEALYGAGNLIAPRRVLTTASGLKIGIVAALGVRAGTVAAGAAPVTFFSGATNEARFGSIVVALQTAVTTLRQADQVDAVILLGHSGIGPQGGEAGEDELFAGLLTGVDLVISGHTHLNTPAPRIMYGPGGKPVPVVQAKPYGREVGRVELVFPDDPARPVRLDPAGTAFLPVDDRVLPTTNPAILGELGTFITYLEAGNPATPANPSFLEETLSTVLGTLVTDDPNVLGDLYFYPLGQTTFDVIGLAPGETNAMNLDTDAMLAAAGGTAFVALQASGPIRGDLLVGETGAISFADLYRVVPLGADPTANPLTDPNALPGFPLVRAIIPTAALRGVIEVLLQQALLDGDFFVAPAGLVVKYDMSRPPFDQTATCGLPVAGLCPGWVTSMALADGTPLYDTALAPFPYFAVDPATSALPVVTTFYIASFASTFGVPLLDDLRQPTTPVAAILRRGDGSAVKDHEALAKYVVDACAANGGFLPSAYDASTAQGAVPRRMIDCTGGCP